MIPTDRLLSPFQLRLLTSALDTPDLRAEYRRRIEIMLLADQGQSQSQICDQLGCAQETARHWITMARAGLAHQWQSTPVGRPKRISNDYRDRLRDLANRSPREFGYPFRRWTGQWLGQHLAQEFGIVVSDRYINYMLKQMGLSTRTAPADAQADDPGTARIHGPIEQSKAS
jgi:transposase